MDRNNMLVGALAGAVVGAVVGALVDSEKGRQLVDSATQGVKDLSNRVTEYAKQNLPGSKQESRTYQGTDVM